MDRIVIGGLELDCIIGVNPEERLQPQRVVISVVLRANLRAAGRSDDVADTIDYSVVKERIRAMVEASSYQLIEALAETVADICLDDPRVQGVEVTVEKPGALTMVRVVGVTIERERGA
jgi:FolB domain-containing protein